MGSSCRFLVDCNQTAKLFGARVDNVIAGQITEKGGGHPERERCVESLRGVETLPGAALCNILCFLLWASMLFIKLSGQVSLSDTAFWEDIN